VLAKRHLIDRKMVLASLLLQRHYIEYCLKCRPEDIPCTPYGQPIFPGLFFNVSKSDGIVVLVGHNAPIGVDIVRVDRSQSESLSAVFSQRELSQMRFSENVEYLRYLGFGLKEAYMKSTGLPNWDDVTEYEFLDLQIPTLENAIVEISPMVYIQGSRKECYTEAHNFENSHFITIFTTARSVVSLITFEKLTIQDILGKELEAENNPKDAKPRSFTPTNSPPQNSS
jgi:4'-phosphopantetheinyl transferase superfamily